MASVSSLSSSSSSSSIYGNRTYNIISGLASGMDTEELISGVVQSYQQKIQSLQKDHTSLEWKQEAYQSISDKLVEFSRNYTSYAYSSTNLLSSSFFNNAVNITTNGANAALITASGKTSSDVVINAVRQLATAARYSVSGNSLNASVSADSSTGSKTIAGGAIAVNDDDTVDVSNLSGSLTFTYGSRTVSINLGQREFFTDEDGNFSAQKLQDAITEKLSQQQISTSGGSGSADKYIGVEVKSTDDGTISISVTDKKNASNSVSITGATGSLGELVGELGDGKASVSLGDSSSFTKKLTLGEFVSGQSLTVSMDGKSKTISLDKFKSISDLDAFQSALNEELKNAFGTVDTGSGKVNKVSATLDKNGISFTMDPSVKNSTFAVTASSSDVGDVLGIGSGLTSYLDTSKTLGELNLGAGFDWTKGTIVMGSGDKAIEQTDESGKVIGYVDADGNAVNANNERLGKDGKVLYGYDLVINGVKIGTYTRDTEMNTVINNINANTEAGVKVDYSRTSGQFIFTAKDTGSSGRVDIESGSLGAALFGATVDSGGTRLGTLNDSYSEGKDALLNVTINGVNMELVRSSNAVDLDGMSVNLSGTFNEDVTEDDIKADKLDATSKVTFTSKTDADTIVDAVKKMVDDFNAIIKEVKSAYSDMPLQQSNGSRYEPLSDDDMADMSDSAIKAYEEKVKTGILFMDSDLSSLYNQLRNAISASGADGTALRSIGISTSYSDGLTTLTFDEQAFRQALDSDPDKVQEAFTKSKDSGAATDGLMTSIQKIIDRYASTTGDPKGILIEKAGSKYSPTAALNNTMLSQMQALEEEISKWQDKMSDKVDYYTNKFTQLEVLMNEMNSQSSALSGLLGG